MMYKLLLDVDHCLAPFNQDAGTERVRELLVSVVGKKGKSLGDTFGHMFYSLDFVHHGNKDEDGFSLAEKLNAYRILFPDKLTDKPVDFRWSRELWLRYLSDEHGLNLNGHTIMEIIDAYWDAISSASQVYPQVLEYLQRWGKNNLFIITGSDRRLVAKNGSFVYDPMFSEGKKIRRVQNQGLGRLFPEDQIIVGDPYDKPSQRFWEKVMQKTSLSKPSNGIVVDDSLSVVLSAINFGFKGYVLDRKGFYKRKDVENQVDGYLTELNQLPRS